MLLRPFLNDATSCSSYVFGCGTHAKLAVVDPHVDLVDDYLATAAALGAPIVAVFETHVQADHRSGLPELVARSGATVYLPTGAGVEFEHVALADGDVIELGNTLVTAIATPGHAPAHHAYTVADRRRGTEEPWLVFSGDSLLIGDVGRPDLHVAGDARGQALLLHTSLKRLLELPDHVVLYPSHYAGSVCGRGLSGNPVSSIGFERAHNSLLAIADADIFAERCSPRCRRRPRSRSGSSPPTGPARWARSRDRPRRARPPRHLRELPARPGSLRRFQADSGAGSARDAEEASGRYVKDIYDLQDFYGSDGTRTRDLRRDRPAF